MHTLGQSIMLLTNPENQLYKLELTLRCMVLDSDGIAKSIGSPLVNEEGLVAILGMVQSVVSQITIMSNFDDNDIMNVMDMLNDTMCIELMMNSKKYGIQNPTARYRIHQIVLTNAFVTMKRALSEGEKRFWKGSQQDITFRNDAGGPPRKKGFLESLSGAWKK